MQQIVGNQHFGMPVAGVTSPKQNQWFCGWKTHENKKSGKQANYLDVAVLWWEHVPAMFSIKLYSAR